MRQPARWMRARHTTEARTGTGEAADEAATEAAHHVQRMPRLHRPSAAREGERKRPRRVQRCGGCCCLRCYHPNGRLATSNEHSLPLSASLLQGRHLCLWTAQRISPHQSKGAGEASPTAPEPPQSTSAYTALPFTAVQPTAASPHRAPLTALHRYARRTHGDAATRVRGRAHLAPSSRHAHSRCVSPPPPPYHRRDTCARRARPRGERLWGIGCLARHAQPPPTLPLYTHRELGRTRLAVLTEQGGCMRALPAPSRPGDGSGPSHTSTRTNGCGSNIRVRSTRAA